LSEAKGMIIYMIKFENTENLTGVSITGDFDDFYSLVEAFHQIQ
jgi:hypothetical protein